MHYKELIGFACSAILACSPTRQKTNAIVFLKISGTLLSPKNIWTILLLSAARSATNAAQIWSHWVKLNMTSLRKPTLMEDSSNVWFSCVISAIKTKKRREALDASLVAVPRHVLVLVFRQAVHLVHQYSANWVLSCQPRYARWSRTYWDSHKALKGERSQILQA